MSASPGADNTEDVLERMTRCGAPITAVPTLIHGGSDSHTAQQARPSASEALRVRLFGL